MKNNNKLLLRFIAASLILNASLYIIAWLDVFLSKGIVEETMNMKFITGVILILLLWSFLVRRPYRSYLSGVAGAFVATGLVGKVFNLQMCLTMGAFNSNMCALPSYSTLISLGAVSVFLLKRNYASFAILAATIIGMLIVFLFEGSINPNLVTPDFLLMVIMLMLFYMMAIDLGDEKSRKAIRYSYPGLTDFQSIIQKFHSHVTK